MNRNPIDRFLPVIEEREVSLYLQIDLLDSEIGSSSIHFALSTCLTRRQDAIHHATKHKPPLLSRAKFIVFHLFIHPKSHHQTGKWNPMPQPTPI